MSGTAEMHEWDEVTRLKWERSPPQLIYISEASVAQMETLRYRLIIFKNARILHCKVWLVGKHCMLWMMMMSVLKWDCLKWQVAKLWKPFGSIFCLELKSSTKFIKPHRPIFDDKSRILLLTSFRIHAVCCRSFILTLVLKSSWLMMRSDVWSTAR